VASSGMLVAIEMRLPMSSMTSLACCCLNGCQCEEVDGGEVTEVVEFVALLAVDPASAEVMSRCESAKCLELLHRHHRFSSGSSRK